MDKFALEIPDTIVIARKLTFIVFKQFLLKNKQKYLLRDNDDTSAQSNQIVGLTSELTAKCVEMKSVSVHFNADNAL